MISARALGAMPRFIQMEAGARGLLRASAVAGLPAGIEQDVSQRSVMQSLDQGARLVGDARIGLVPALHLTPAAYGVWGDYVLSAPTLADAIRRTLRALRGHGSRDELGIDDRGDQVAYTYRLASTGQPGYENIACAAAGVLLNLVRCYLGQHWRPECIEFDLPPGLKLAAVQDAFGCRVRYGAGPIGIVFGREHLAARRPADGMGLSVMLADVRRARQGGSPETIPDIVHELVRLLLLAERDLSITHIATELGYSAPGHFARAFARATGRSPRQFRTTRAAAGG